MQFLRGMRKSLPRRSPERIRLRPDVEKGHIHSILPSSTTSLPTRHQDMPRPPTPSLRRMQERMRQGRNRMHKLRRTPNKPRPRSRRYNLSHRLRTVPSREPDRIWLRNIPRRYDRPRIRTNALRLRTHIRSDRTPKRRTHPQRDRLHPMRRTTGT